MSRVQSRLTSAGFELAGIRDAETGPRVSDDIQLVYLAGNIDHLLPPFPVSESWWTFIRVPAAADRSALILSTPPDTAIEVYYLAELQGSVMEFSVRAPADTIQIAPAAATPEFTSGIASRTTAAVAHVNLLGAGARMNANQVLTDTAMPIRVGAGQQFVCITSAINTPMTMSLAHREVPLPAVA